MMAGGSPMTPWMARIFEMVEDGPRKRTELVGAVLDMVPPGRADRAWRYQLRWTAADRGYNTQAAPSDRTIRAGARMLVQQNLWSAIKRGRLGKYRDEHGVEWVHKGREVIVPSHEQYSERAKRGAEKFSGPRRSEVRRKGWANMSEEARQRVRDGALGMASGKASARSKKGWETRRRTYTTEEISRQNQHAGSAKRSHEKGGGGTDTPPLPRQDDPAYD